jgi:hypothetical protein
MTKNPEKNTKPVEMQDERLAYSQCYAHVSALFVKKDSIYKELGLDCWDIDRDAQNYAGTNPVICHPPCRAWGNLSHIAKPRPGEKELAIFSVNQVRKWGGVLEHPRKSKLWNYMGLPYPGKYDEYGGFSICIDQHWFGHKAQKRTLLYICGVDIKDLPRYPITLNQVEFCVGTSRDKGYIKEMPKKEREDTPLKLANWLIEVACKGRGV